MKKTNIIIFIICALVVVSGLVSSDLWFGLGKSVLEYTASVKTEGFESATAAFTAEAERVVTEKLSYHGLFMDINSVVLRLTNTKVVEKGDTTVVRATSGVLANPRPYMEDEKLQNRADSVKKLADAAEKSGTKFLYVMAPTKGYSLKYAHDVEDFTKSNCDRFIWELKKRDVPILNLVDKMKGVPEKKLFFATDHHWRPEYAFHSAREIAQTLKDRYGFSYDKSVFDMSNYNIKVYKNWFLGSQGKKTGRFYANGGADDISIITPEFDTALVEEQPAKGTRREGSFMETVLYMENVATKDLYNLNPYAAYSGGDFREQIITNKLNPDGETILLVRDSFSCAMAPFLGLATSRMNCVDVRDGGYVGNKINVYEYIEALKPDYLVVMYTGVSAGEDLFDFE